MLLRDRKTPRAKWHDYKGGEYFVTICTKDRVHFFGEVYGGEMRMTSIGKMLKQEIEKTEKIRGGEVSIPLYVIMPNHVHLIVVVSCRTHRMRPGPVQKWTHAMRPYKGKGRRPTEWIEYSKGRSLDHNRRIWVR